MVGSSSTTMELMNAPSCPGALPERNAVGDIVNGLYCSCWNEEWVSVAEHNNSNNKKKKKKK